MRVRANIVVTVVALSVCFWPYGSLAGPIGQGIVTLGAAVLGLLGTVLCVGVIPSSESRRAGIVGIILGLLPIPLGIVGYQLMKGLAHFHW
jgi:hypothetical protein